MITMLVMVLLLIVILWKKRVNEILAKKKDILKCLFFTLLFY
jgi:hypothetical protein